MTSFMRTTGCKAFLLFLLLQGFEAQISYVAVHSGKCADRGFLTIKSKGKCEFARSTIRSWAYVSGDTVALTAQTYYESGYAYGCLLHYNNLIFQAWSSSIGCGEYFVGPNWYDTGVMVVRFYYLFLTVFRFVWKALNIAVIFFYSFFYKNFFQCTGYVLSLRNRPSLHIYKRSYGQRKRVHMWRGSVLYLRRSLLFLRQQRMLPWKCLPQQQWCIDQLGRLLLWYECV